MSIVIIGGGIAGLSAAVRIREQGSPVTVVSKTYPTQSQSVMAQGGMNAALGADDSVEQHMEDTLKAAYRLADETAVRYLCESAPEAVVWLDRLGVPFSRGDGGQIARRKLGGSRYERSCYAQDYTGLKILHTLHDQCLKLGVNFLHERLLLRLKTERENVTGAIFLNMQTGKCECVQADRIILATGGFAGIYGHHSTNSSAATGEGIAIASEAGAELEWLEFVQFHPTALATSSVLISESARGAGGYLLDEEGQRFVDELLPRDQVARAIYGKQQEGSRVFLDIRHLGEAFINEHLPQERKLAKIYEQCDPVNDLIPIKPAAHYTMGGVKTHDLVRSSLDGLLVCGECGSGSVHGANRMGGNSLLEAVVFGWKCAEVVVQESEKSEVQISETADEPMIEEIFDGESTGNFYPIKQQMADVLQSGCGVVRNQKGLEQAAQALEEMEKRFQTCGVDGQNRQYNVQLRHWIEFRSSLALAKKLVRSAMNRKESVGSHYRDDEGGHDAA